MNRKSMRVLGCIVLIAGILGAVSPAWADWNPGDFSKWQQLPDLTSKGVDVRVSQPVTLADDFRCTGSGPITDIHIWGSSLNNQQLPPMTFLLGIWSDVPAGLEPYSHPGSLLWSRTFQPGQYQYRVYASGTEEFFWDPLGQYNGFDSVVGQVNFFINPQDAYSQTKDTIYWLSATVLNVDFPVGWKTTDLASRWNDDAVWLDPAGNWHPLTYFPGHPYAGQSMDLAFVITPVPGSLLLLGSGLLGLVGWRFRRR